MGRPQVISDDTLRVAIARHELDGVRWSAVADEVALDVEALKSGVYRYRQRNNHRVVKVRLDTLTNVIETLSYWINRERREGMSKQDYDTWMALGNDSRAMRELRALTRRAADAAKEKKNGTKT